MMKTTTTIPAASTFTSAPMRHRLRLELHAPVAEVWALVGSHARLPEYSSGIATVEVEGTPGAQTRTCRFHSPDGSTPGPSIRERVRWEEVGVGYATSAEPNNDFGLSNTLSLVTVQPVAAGTLFTWEEHYDSTDLPASRASYSDGFADIAQHLTSRFGGKVLERYVDVPDAQT